MLTSYEKHLYEVLVQTQQKLNDEVGASNYLSNRNKEIELERNRYREYWLDSSTKADRLEKELKALKEKEEQNAGTSYPSTKVITSGMSIVKGTSTDVKEAV